MSTSSITPRPQTALSYVLSALFNPVSLSVMGFAVSLSLSYAGLLGAILAMVAFITLGTVSTRHRFVRRAIDREVDYMVRQKRERGLARSAQLPFVILLDLVMPNMDGWQFLEERSSDLRLAGMVLHHTSGRINRVVCLSEAVDGGLGSLASQGAIPLQQLEHATLATQSAHAGLREARASLAASDETRNAAGLGITEAQGRLAQSRPVDAQIEVAHATAALARGRVTTARASLDVARLQLAYTHVVAPGDGRVSNLTARVSETLSAGQPVAQFVPDRLYVTADFKETQIGEMRVGQRAKISIDAYPHRSFEGCVESLSAGTGAVFRCFHPTTRLATS